MTIFKDRIGQPLTAKQAASKIAIRLYNYMADFCLFLLHLVFAFVPFHHIRRLAMRLGGAHIGKGTSIHMGCRFFSLRDISIGEDTIIGNGVFLDGRAPIVIGNHVDIASEVMIYNSEHDVNSEDFRVRKQPVEVGDHVFIGPRVIILPGVKVGRGAVIAAGAVVTSSVPPLAIIGGVPAKIIGERKIKTPNYRLGRARLFQ